MRKLHKRCIALAVIFTSIMSFLPIQFGGLVAKAATEGTDIQVSIYGSTTALTPTIDTSSSKQQTIYTTETTEDGFNVTVSDVKTTKEKLTQLAQSSGTSQTGIVDQEIQILSINGIQRDGVGTDTDPNFSTIGVEISEYANPSGATKQRVGKTIKNLPFGVNKIEYRIITTTLTMNCTMVNGVDSNGNTTKVAQVTQGSTNYSNYSSEYLTIEHGTKFAVNKIDPMIFNAYIGQQDVDNATTISNNTRPFLYSTTAKSDPKMELRYNFNVPDSISTLTYDMTFDNSLILDGAKVYKNGQYDSSVTITSNSANDGYGKLHGSLSKMGQSDIILIKLDSGAANSDTSIQKAYAIEIRYNSLNSDKDYSLKDAGITKLNYNNETDVPAYIGKKFSVNTISDDDDTPVYKGEIHIDKRAGMISLDPTLVRSKSTVTYEVTNNYVDSSGATTKSKKSELKNGKQYIDFMAGTVSNTLQVDVYEGDGESITGNLLARYLLTVDIISDTQSSDLTLLLDDGNAELTQPGVRTNKLTFSTSRRTYDLYTSGQVDVKLQGTSNKNEYIKVWLADEVDSNNLTETDESKANEFSETSGLRSDNLNINVGTSKKMVVQAYYDEYTTDATTGKHVLTASYPVGDKYYFYLPNNFSSTDTSATEDKSSDALLSSLKVKEGTLVDSDGNNGFSIDQYDYNVEVAKEDTSVNLTAVAEDGNVESMVATIDSSENTYDLVSGETTELPLSSNGTTNIKIVVTAQDGSTTKTYNVVVKNSTKSSDDTLKNVILNTGDYTFDSTEDTTKVRVDQDVTSIKVTPVANDSNSKVTVNGEKYSTDPITVSLKGAQTTDIEIVVKSEDGESTTTYTLEVTRSDSEDTSDTSDGSDEEDQFYDDVNQCWVDLTKYDEWGKVNGKPVYFDKKNRQVKDQWIQTKGEWYYLNSSGYRSAGWKTDTSVGKTYYLDPVTGKLKTGWMNLNNVWYNMGTNGTMHKGWLYANQKWYYFAPNGQMVANQSMYIDGKMYKFAEDGSVIA